MKNLLVAPIIVATLGASSFALAGGPDNMNQAPATGSVVFGVDAGAAWAPALPLQDIGVTHTGQLGHDTYTKDSSSENHLVLGAHAGYMYNVMPKLAVGLEMGYLHLGQNQIKASEALLNNNYTYKVSQQLVSLLPTINYNVYNGLGVFAQAGPALVFQKDDFASTVPGATEEQSFHKVEGLVGAGVDYNIHNVILSVEYDHLFGKKPAASDVTQGANGATQFSKNIYSSNMVLAGVGYALPV